MKSKKNNPVLRDIRKVPEHMQMDERTRNDNIDKKLHLCEICDGTGNELFSMYKKCSNCDESGVKKELDT